MDSRADDVTRVSVSAREMVDVGPSDLQSTCEPTAGPVGVEDSLACALGLAAKAQRWDIVAKLARELEA
ncbi:MAG TPA: hypothetical protein VGY54_26090, partial [Polyangiaceae bacterium]|nr:hypothetical protein [Polyangiaceae bacterium]